MDGELGSVAATSIVKLLAAAVPSSSLITLLVTVSAGVMSLAIVQDLDSPSPIVSAQSPDWLSVYPAAPVSATL